LAIDSLFVQAQNLNKKFDFYISFFEIYGGRLFDLLNNKNKLQVLEDKNQKVQIFGLEEKIAQTPDDMRAIIDLGNSIRTTHNTVTNETSSRSHAICNVIYLIFFLVL
jgi:kinesin family protein 2/24